MQQEFQHAKALLRSRLKKVGYAYAEVQAEARVRLDRRSVAVRLSAKPGPLVRFGRCIFKGHGKIPEDKLQRQVTWTPGQRFDARKVVQTRNRLLNLKVFTDVSTAIPETPGKVADVTITVRQGKLRELRVGGGLGLEMNRQEAHLSAHWTWRNFLGGLRTLAVKAKPAFISMPTLWDSKNYGPGLESHVKLTQPYFMGSAFSLYGKLGYDVVVEEGYQMHGVELKAGAERFFVGTMLRWGASWNLLFFDAFNRKTAYEQWDADQPWIDHDPFRAAFLETFLQLDLRDDVADPRAGFWASARLELGHTYLGSDYSYLRITPEVRGYIPLGTKRVVLALRAMLGYLHPFSGDDDSPMYRRYKLGGPTSHRGFSSGRLSAQLPDPKNPTVAFAAHGNAAVLLSGDIRVRVVKLLGNWLHLGAFADGGDSVLDFDDLDLGPTTFRLDARSTLFDLGLGPLKDSAFFGNLSVDGKLAGSTLAANVRLSNGSLKMAGLGGDRTLHSTKPLEDVVFEQKQDPRKGRVREAPRKPSKPLKLKIKAVVEPLRIRRDDFDLEAETDVRVRTDPRGRLRLHGWAGLRQGGTLNVMGARYTVERAKVHFSGKPDPDPTLDVLLSRHIQTIMVLIGVGGSARR